MPAWLIVVVIVSALLGSVLWILPSPGERRRGQLRALAQKEGARARFLDAEVEHQIHDLCDTKNARAIAYVMPRQTRGRSNGSTIWLREAKSVGEVIQLTAWGEGRLSLAPRLAVAATPLKAMPECVWGIEVSAVEVRMLWGESGDASMLDAALKVLRELSLHAPS